jgi:hypothetical protein
MAIPDATLGAEPLLGQCRPGSPVGSASSGTTARSREQTGQRLLGVADFENARGVVVIEIQVGGIPSCSSGTSPTAPIGSNDALVERAARGRDCAARGNCGHDREGV